MRCRAGPGWEDEPGGARLEYVRGLIRGAGLRAAVCHEIRQVGGDDPVAERLAAIPEVLEVYTITGTGDMLCRVVARTNADLQRVLDAIVSAQGVVRASTAISLAPGPLPDPSPRPRAAGGGRQQ